MPKLKIDKYNIHYKIIGSGKQPIIFLHGIYFDLSLYNRVAKNLAADFTCYLIDLPMHGRSDSPKSFSGIPDLVLMIEKFVENFNLKNFYLFAHSGGSIVALNYAANFPVKKLFLSSPAGFVRHGSIKAVYKGLAKSNFNHHIVKHPLLTAEKSAIASYNFLKNVSSDHYRKILEENIDKDYSALLEKISCPVILLWGERDHLFPVEKAPDFKKFPNCRLIIIKNEGHNWLHFLPGEAAEMIREN